MNHILQEDIEYIAMSKSIEWKELENKSVLVTGATGLIGSQIIMALDEHNKSNKNPITIYAYARNEEKARKKFEDCTTYVKIVIGDICDDIKIDKPIDYIIHGASITGSKQFVDCPVETIMTGIEGTKNILEFAREKQIKGMVYLSSLEVDGVTDFSLKSVKEDQYGYIEQLSPRSSYSEGKRMIECMCVSYGSEYGVPVKIVRLSQTFGPGVSYEDGRVFAQFARAAIENKNIVLKTKGETYRNYCYTRDAVIGILCVLLKGEKREAYNIANEETGISICDMARLVAEDIKKRKIKVIFDIDDDIEKLGYAPTIKIALNTKKVQKLGWKAEIGLKEAYNRMIEYMKDTKGEKY